MLSACDDVTMSLLTRMSLFQACDTVELTSADSKTKLQHMSKMFQMYSAGEFTPGCDIWLAGICRYLNEAYSSLAVQTLRLLTTVSVMQLC